MLYLLADHLRIERLAAGRRTREGHIEKDFEIRLAFEHQADECDQFRLAALFQGSFQGFTFLERIGVVQPGQ
jgi:hypothetical protein